jgi:hypothetical protein
MPAPLLAYRAPEQAAIVINRSPRIRGACCDSRRSKKAATAMKANMRNCSRFTAILPMIAK